MLSVLLWCFSAVVYFFGEVVYKTACGRPESISWTMLLLALIAAVPLERCGVESQREWPIWAQAIACGLMITGTELIAGLVLNVWLGFGVWDYSHQWGNLWGQICPRWSAVWCLVSGPAIVLLDWMRYAIQGGVRPRHVWRWRH